MGVRYARARASFLAQPRRPLAPRRARELRCGVRARRRPSGREDAGAEKMRRGHALPGPGASRAPAMPVLGSRRGTALSAAARWRLAENTPTLFSL